MSDNEYYSLIAEELKNNTPDQALWTRAIAEASGNPEKTQAMYIRLRLADLKRQAAHKARASAPSGGLALVDDTPKVEAVAPEPQTPAPPAISGELMLLRSRLKRELRTNNRANFYQLLNLAPDASQHEIEAAISAHEAKAAAEHVALTPEFKLARETLRNDDSREEYDRKLLDSLLPPDMRPSVRPPVQRTAPSAPALREPGLFESLWETVRDSGKLPFVVGFILVLISLGVGSYVRDRLRLNAEIRQAQVFALEAQQASMASEAAMLENERRAIDGSLELGNKVVDRASEHSRDYLRIRREEEDRRRQEMEYQAQRDSQYLEMERQRHERRLENDRLRQDAARERREDDVARRQNQYWSCMNGQLSRGVGSARAGEACARYK